MKLNICLMGFLCLYFSVKSQINPAPKFLTVGDQVPDIQISGIMNSTIKTAKLSDYKGKVVILDFWNTWCSSCVGGFPEWDMFQHQYPNDLQVFLVDKKNRTETEKAVKNVINLTSINTGKPFRLPIVFNDTTLVRYFQFNTVPHVVWIGRDGKVIAITAKQSVTAENMAKVIRGDYVSFPVKTMKDFN